MKQNILLWSADSNNYVGGKLKAVLETKIKEGHRILQVIPTYTEFTGGALTILKSAIIITETKE